MKEKHVLDVVSAILASGIVARRAKGVAEERGEDLL